MESGIAELGKTAAEHAVIGTDNLGFERSQSDDHFEGRTRRVLSRYRLVDKRRLRIGDEPPPRPGRQAGNEFVGIVTGHRGQRQDVAVADIHDHGRGAFLFAQPVRRHFLEVAVDGQTDVIPGLSFLARQFPDHAADRIHLDLAVAGLPAEIEVENPFDAVLADLEARQFQQRIPGYFLFGHRRNISEHMGEILCKRIPAADSYRHETAPPPDFAQDALALVVFKRDDPGQRIEHRVDIAHLLRHQRHAVVFLVDSQRPAVSVDNAATRRRQKTEIDPVLVGEGLVLVGFDDLQLIHPPGQDAEQDHLPAAEDGDPAGKRFVAARVLIHRAAGRSRAAPGPGTTP